MALINPVVQLANVANHKDSRWLTLEVCREFQRSKCSRSDQECKFAHPPPHVEVQNGRVTCCFDSIKGKCARKDPPCKYLHPPQHLREQLLQNGRNNLILRNIQMQALAAQVTTGLPPMVPSMMPVAYDASGKPISYSPAMIPGQTYVQSPYIAASQSYPYSAMTSMSGILPTAVTSDPSAITHPQAAASPNSITTTVSAHKIQRPDRLEPVVEVKTALKRPRDPADDLVLQYTGGIPQTAMGFPPTMLNYYNYKRPALADGKSGLPVYQPATMVNYQTLAAMQMAGQPQAYVPMSFAGHPPNMPRF